MKNPNSQWAALCKEFEEQQKIGSQNLVNITRRFARSALLTEDDLNKFDATVENMEGIIRRMRKFLKSEGESGPDSIEP